MSVNITVNGKFAKHCRTHTLLDDPKQVRKQEEQERRKLRLLQVREESKKLARKIREEVNEEKKRELQKLKDAKENEFECWRQLAIERKEGDYRSAIFQIGTAHNAARNENHQKAEQQQQKQVSYKDFKKKIAARKCKVQFQGNNTCICKQTQVCPNKQFQCSCTQTKQTDEAHKRKRDLSFSSSESECEDEGYKEQTLLQSSLSSTSSICDSSLSSLPNNRATQTSMFIPTTNKNLHQTPTVFLDVEVGTDDSVSITAPAEVYDKHAEYNRQFSKIRVSPTKGEKTTDNRLKNPQPQQSSTTTSLTTTSCKTIGEEREVFKTANENAKEKQLQQAIQPTKEKRFTLISDLVRKQQDQPKTTDSSPIPIQTPNNQLKSINPRPPVSRATSEAQAPQLSPRKQARPVLTTGPSISRPLSQSPRKASASSKSSKTITEKSHPNSNATATANTVVISGSSSSGRVQFYDYNSKLSRDCAQAQTTAQVQRHHDFTQPTAMEQAALENQRERERHQEQLQKCKQAEERGQKAMEREQVRRDCSELTERLEALTREYPKQVPTSENQVHLFADKQLRKEGKMNSAVEKLLNKPNIITCSELNKPSTNNGHLKTSENLGNMCNELNVGASGNNVLPADDVSSDSCCSILLGYVDDQSRLVREDLQQWPNNEEKKNIKQKRLKNLLQRLDSLRNSLMQELKTESESLKVNEGIGKSSSKEENLRQMIDSISELRKEREQILVKEIETKPKPLREREKELQAKEAILEKKVREFFELQMKQNKSEIISTKKETIYAKNKETQESSSSSDKEVKEVDESEEYKENTLCTAVENPLEIIITVRGETKCIQIPQKPKRKLKVTKCPSKLASLIRSPQPKGTHNKRQTPKKKAPVSKPSLEQGVLKRQNSYDSNSTSYMSLPTELPTKLNDLAQRIAKERQNPTPTLSTQVEARAAERISRDQRDIRQNSSILDGQQESESSIEPLDDTPAYQPPAHINPLIAQYVQRLLGMSRNNVQKLGVSSSDIETPGSTIVNTSGNITSSEGMISDERFINIHNFVEENRSFIKDLEQSIKSQNNESLENSLRVFDEIWRQRLKNQNTGKAGSKQKPPSQFKKAQEKERTKTPQKTKEAINGEERQRNFEKDSDADKSSKENSLHKKCSLVKEKERRTREFMKIISSASKTASKEDTIQKSLTDQGKNNKNPTSNLKNSRKTVQDIHKDFEKTISSQYSTDDKETPKPVKRRPRPVDKADKPIETRVPKESNKTEADTQIARYAKLTENCTHRIAELTELITRVREEKQRLLEVTLSSVSDTGRQSTEYLELPDGKSSTRNDQEDLTRISSSSEEATQTKQPHSTITLYEMPQLSPSDKNKQITASRDSGIAESRPMTAQENRLDQEPISQSSSESTIPLPARKLKPPPTIKRFSPQLPDDELAHELSTILEVDTPATSRINTAVGQSTDERINVTDMGPQHPVKFPTFAEYVKNLDLDITQLNPEHSMQLQQEFCSYLEWLQQQQSPAYPLQYDEFPSVNAYIEDLCEGKHGVTIEDSLAQLRISGIHPHNFPAVREYLQRNASKTSPDNLQLIDTESLENISEEPIQTNTENDSASMDIEEELKKRKIMKNPFRYVQTKQQKMFSSTANKDGAFYREMIATESGVDILSTSDNSMTILESELKRMVHQRPSEVKTKSQKYHVLSSTTTSTNTSDLANSALRAASMDNSAKEGGRPLNLRDFLTRELLKHANISTSSSSCDESLRSHFLNSIIGSLTPRTNRAASKSEAQTLDRQKTSTPVPIQSSQTHSHSTSDGSNTSSHLFSGESRLSSVHSDHSVRLVTSAGVNADHSSE